VWPERGSGPRILEIRLAGRGHLSAKNRRALGQITIEIDPHEGSHTATAIDGRERVLARPVCVLRRPKPTSLSGRGGVAQGGVAHGLTSTWLIVACGLVVRFRREGLPLLR
jgi:hypothetical protein